MERLIDLNKLLNRLKSLLQQMIQVSANIIKDNLSTDMMQVW